MSITRLTPALLAPSVLVLLLGGCSLAPTRPTPASSIVAPVAQGTPQRPATDSSDDRSSPADATPGEDAPRRDAAPGQGWLEPYVHTHHNSRGTPLLHLFGAEPAFLGRDLILSASYTDEDEGQELELEAELEWAFTRRLGLVIEAPYRWLRPDADDERDEDGVGDLALAPRAVLLQSDRLVLSLNMEVEVPVGSERRGLGGGEVALAPSLSWWSDLVGGRLAWSGQVGTEHRLESGDDELFYTTGLTLRLFGGTGAHAGHDHAGERHASGLAGLTALTLELSGRTDLSEDVGRSTGEGLVGLNVFVTDGLELRAGVRFPVMRPKALEVQYTVGLLWHF